MKDKNLENQFGDYFNSLDKPKNITADAKREVKMGGRRSAKILKIASVAACLLLVCTVTVLSLKFALPAAPPADVPAQSRYSLSSLTAESADAYAIDAQAKPSLAPVYKLAYAENAQVVNFTEYKLNGDTLVAQADIIMLDNGSRQDVTMYIANPDGVCEELKYIDGGAVRYYGDLPYCYISDYDDGEPVARFSITHNGAKYYVSVKCSDESAYLKYLSLIFS